MKSEAQSKTRVSILTQILLIILSLLESHILPGFRIVSDAVLLNSVDKSEAQFLLHFLKE